MKRALYYLITDCISFTLLVLICSLLSVLGVLAPISGPVIWEYFACTTVIALLMFIVDGFLGTDVSAIRIIAHLACVALPVFIMGGLLFRWFPFTLFNVAFVVGLLLFIYAVVFTLITLKTRQEARAINQAIQEKKARGQQRA